MVAKCSLFLYMIFFIYYFIFLVFNERTTHHGQPTGKHYHMRLRVECTLFVICKAGHEPTPYWLVWIYNSLSHRDTYFYTDDVVWTIVCYNIACVIHIYIQIKVGCQVLLDICWIGDINEAQILFCVWKW